MRSLFYRWAGALIVLLGFTTTHAWAEQTVGLYNDPPMVYGFCPPGQKQVGNQCLEQCPAGYADGILNTCVQLCPSGYTDLGASCSNLDIKFKTNYSRAPGTAMQCPAGTEKSGLLGLCYASCKPGFTGDGGICWGRCPAGTDFELLGSCIRTPRWPSIIGYTRVQVLWTTFSWPIWSSGEPGWSQAKPNYTRNPGTLPDTCSSGTEKSEGRCYPACKTGYTGIGALCWQNCPTGYSSGPLGLTCTRDTGFFKQIKAPVVKGTPEVCPAYPKDTTFPIILVHGTFGFDTMGVLGSYFNGVADALSKDGATVYGVTVSAVASNEERGRQLAAFVKTIYDKHQRPVHLIGHSHGAPTARFVAGDHPDWVASVTSIGGVNYGSNVADDLLGLLPDGSPQQAAVAQVANAFGGLITLMSGKSIFDYTQNATGALHSLTTSGSLEFNKHYPRGLHGRGQSADTPLDENDGFGNKARPMLFYSWTGKAPFLRPTLGTPAMTAVHMHAFQLPFNENSDGLVGEKSAYFGQFLGGYHHDHLTEVLGAPNDTSFNNIAHPMTLYCEHAARLKEAEQNLLKPAYIKNGFAQSSSVWWDYKK